MFTISIDLGIKKITIPVADLEGKRPGKTLLVTAGVDGNEYASIEAAYALIKQYNGGNFSGRLIVIPLFNIPGFFDEVSFNPMDKKFPKFIYPGERDGTPTERLMHWLHTTYVTHCDIWLDLHGGGLTERIDPFLWVYKTKNPTVNTWIDTFLTYAAGLPTLQLDAPVGGKAAYLAKQNKGYIIAEAGHSGERKKEMIALHTAWVQTAMRILGMIKKPLIAKKKTIYRKIHFYEAKKEGLWYPGITIESGISKGMTLGTIYSWTYQRIEQLRAKEDGRILWMKEGMAARKGDVLVAVGYNE